MAPLKSISIWSFTFLRILIGWHFLYEGVVKVFNPEWTSAYYLREAKWLFSGFFQWLISDSTVLSIVDFMNAWGMVVIGVCLFLGVYTRVASVAGAALLILYYIASPPFVYSSLPSVSNFFIVNYNIIEAAVLIAIAVLPTGYLYGIERYFKVFITRRKEKKFPSVENHDILRGHDAKRRELIKNLAVVPLFGAVFFGMAKKRGWISSYEEDSLTAGTDGISGASLYLGREYSIHELEGKVPSGTIKGLEFSRLMIGGNLISGFAHSRDLIYVSTWLKRYFTDEKVIETLWLCQACGIDTAVLRCDHDTIRILKKFWSRGGRVKWLAQTYPDGDDLSNVKLAIDNGAVGAFVQGNIADRLVREKRTEYIGETIDYIKSQGIIAGTAAHSLSVPQACVKDGFNPDFYLKTFHHLNYPSAAATPFDPSVPYLPDQKDPLSIWCMGSEPTEKFFETNTTPWIAFKVLAAGAIKPDDGFRHTFEGGADFACVGMFDFQVIENANIAFRLFEGNQINRNRDWCA